MYETCNAGHNAIELTSQQTSTEELLRMNSVVNLNVAFRVLGSFSYTTTQAPPEEEANTVTRPPYTFPKPVALQEPEEIVCLPSL